MSVPAVARKDFQDAVRSRGLLILAFVFVVFFVSSAYFFTEIVGTQVQQQSQQQGVQFDLTSDAFVRALSEVTTILIPFIGVVVAYASVVGERESGTLKLLLSLPHSRLDVVVGKVLGRGAVVGLPVVVGFAAGMLVFPFTPVSLAATNYVLFALLTAVLGIAFVALAVGVSAGASTNRRAVVGAVGVYVVFTLFWNSLVNGLLDQITRWRSLCPDGGVGPATCDVHAKVHLLLKHLNPTQAYKSLATRLVVDDAAQARASLFNSPIQQQIYLEQMGDPIPIYLSDPVVLLYLLVWVVVPPAIGYYVFERTDL